VIIRVDTDTARVALAEPQEFTRFHVEAGGNGDLAAALAPHGTVEGDHAWIRLDALERLAGEVDEGWRRGFGEMTTYAADHGFLSEDGEAIRAHVERA